MKLRNFSGPFTPSAVKSSDAAKPNEVRAESLPIEVRQQIEQSQTGASPLYLTQKANTVLAPPIEVSPLQAYAFPKRISFHLANLPIKPFLIDPRTKFGADALDGVASFAATKLDVGYPDAASVLGGVSVVVGVYGCINKMLQGENTAAFARPCALAIWL
jgi:hypothetical protein